MTVLELGERSAALRLLSRAAAQLPDDEPGHRAVDFLFQARAHGALGNFTRAGDGVAVRPRSRAGKSAQEKDAAHYRAGYAAARQRARPAKDEANLLLYQATTANRSSNGEPRSTCHSGRPTWPARTVTKRGPAG